MTLPCAEHECSAALGWLSQVDTTRFDGSRPPAGIVWITGLSGVGKSSLAARVVNRLRAAGEAVAWLDGDALRRRLACDAGYARSDRERLALDYSALAARCAVRGRHAVVSTISLLHGVHAANRAHGLAYLEVWLRAPEAQRRARAADHAHGAAEAPRVGIELAAEFPRAPHLALDNDGALDDLDRLAERVLEGLTDVRGTG